MAAHLWLWYLPRPRTGLPDPEDLPAALIESGDGTLRLWLAYPHQTLGALARAQPALAELWAGSLPPFAVFRAPPSREIALTVGPSGGVAAARVFPLVALTAKAAGRLASNPWLSGGSVVIAGAPGDVEWRRNLWIARWGDGSIPARPSPGAARSRAGGAGLPTEPQTALAWLDPEALGFEVPARGGLWTVRSEGERILLARVGSGESPARGFAAATAIDHLTDDVPSDLALFALRDSGAASEALFVMDHAQDPGILRLPSAALASTGSVLERRVFELPARELLDALGARLREDSFDRWSLVATDRRSAELARELLERTDSEAGSAGTAGSGVAESWLVVLRPPAIHRLARGIDEVFETLPVGSPDARRRWRRYREWTGSLVGVEWVGLWIAPDQIEMRTRAGSRVE